VKTVRGTDVLATVGFVVERFGSEAHERVLKRIAPEAAAAVRSVDRDGQRIPWPHLRDYTVASKRLLAPDDADYYRQMGFFVGRSYVERGGFGVMVKDRRTAARMIPTFWRSIVEDGEMSIVSDDEAVLVVRLTEFPVAAVICERLVGAFEAALGPRRIEHTSCETRGDAHCEWTLWF